MTLTVAPAAAAAAVVTRTPAFANEPVYLKLDEAGHVAWTADPREASAFASMREAARMAFRLPAALRAFGMLRNVEADVYTAVH